MSVDDVRLDVLGAGREPDRRRWTVVAVVLVVLAALGATTWYLDFHRRQDESAAISRCAARAQAAFVESTIRVSGMAEYVRPALAFASESAARGLYGMVAHEAAGADDSLQQARNDCAAVDLLGWHWSQRAALVARLAFVDSELALLADTSSDGQAYFQDRSRIQELEAAADSRLTAARPHVPW